VVGSVELLLFSDTVVEHKVTFSSFVPRLFLELKCRIHFLLLAGQTSAVAGKVGGNFLGGWAADMRESVGQEVGIGGANTALAKELGDGGAGAATVGGVRKEFSDGGTEAAQAGGLAVHAIIAGSGGHCDVAVVVRGAGAENCLQGRRARGGAWNTGVRLRA
jgi:hypothetical protein